MDREGTSVISGLLSDGMAVGLTLDCGATEKYICVRFACTAKGVCGNSIFILSYIHTMYI